MTRWLVVGASGQVGRELADQLAGDALTALSRDQLDIQDEAAVHECLSAVRPQIVINAAAYTRVDDAESDERSAFAVNGLGARSLAVASEACGARLVHISTDYVFDGDGHKPYDEDAPTAPRTAYGRSKRAGEEAVLGASDRHYVVRTSWVYGLHGSNFVKTMLSRAHQDGPTAVVDDQHGSPTYAVDLAAGLVALGASEAPGGIYHCTNADSTTWFGLARHVFALARADPDRVTAIPTSALARPAPRPRYSVLDNQRWVAAGLPAMRSWDDAVAAALDDQRWHASS